MKKIQSQEQLIQWAKDVNHSTNTTLCDYQDTFAHSDQKDLHNYFIDMTQNEKELIIFSISKAMGSATLFDFVKTYSNKKAQDYIDSEGIEVDRRYGDLVQKEYDVKLKGESFQLSINALEHQNEELVKDNERLTTGSSNQTKLIWHLESRIEDLEKIVGTLRAFESHVQGLLNAA